MPGTRGKDKESDSLVEKVKQLSPGSHASLGTGGLLTRTARKSQTQQMPTNIDLPMIYQLIMEVKDAFDEHKQMVSTQISELTSNFEDHVKEQIATMEANIKEEIKKSAEQLTNYVDLEVGRLTSQIEDVKTRVTTLEQNNRPEFDPEVSIIMSKVPKQEGEDIQKIAEEIIHEGLRLPEVPVVRAMRLRQREHQPGRRPPPPPLVKVELPDLDTKKKVLKAKLRLGETANEYSNVWLRSSKPHVERLIDLNFRTILDMIPGGDRMSVTNSGRIVKKDN